MASNSSRVLAVIPARGGSKGLPDKNILPFIGLPLITHSILFAKSCPEISRCIISTDASSISDIALKHGGDVPFQRPAELALDTTPTWPVLRHALSFCEKQENQLYDYLVLLEPTTPCRLPRYVTDAFSRLHEQKQADGIVAVSKPDSNPIWHSVINREGWMTDLIPGSSQLTRRQDVPTVFRINGALYIWKAEFVRNNTKGWRHEGKYLMLEIPDSTAISIDTQEQFQRAEMFVKKGLFSLPWLNDTKAASWGN